jgi:hypothetical protein
VPRLTTRICSAPNCHEIGTDVAGGWRCAKHTVDKWAIFRASPHGREISGGYSSRRWRKLRDRRMRDAHGRCEVCGGVATEVHHIAGERPTDSGFYDIERVRAVCTACHRKAERERRRIPSRR